MTKLFSFLAAMTLALACVAPVAAQTATGGQTELHIGIGARQITFTPLRAYEQLRLEVFNNVGELLYDSGAIAEANLNWNLQNANGAVLTPGLYAYTLSIKAPGVEAPRRHQGHFIIEKGADQIWLTAKSDDGVSAEVLSGELTIARNPAGTTAGTGYVAAGRTLGERAGLQRDAQGRTVADKNNGVTREGGQSTLNISGSGTTNRMTKWLDGPNGVVGDSIIHETAAGDLGIGTTFPGGVLDVQRNSPNPLIGRFWNTGTGPAQLRFVGGTGATSQFLITDTAEWLTSIAVSNSIGMQLRVRGVGTPNNEAELSNSARLTMLRNGNVGIGTTAPAARLDVAGDLRSSALRQELTASSPNLINGFMGTGSGGATPGNRVTAGIVGASIGGGGFNGTLNYPSSGPFTEDGSNQVTDWFGTVGGGLKNVAGSIASPLDDGLAATVGGGYENTASCYTATVGGGFQNTASAISSVVPGGYRAVASHYGEMAFASGSFLTTAFGDAQTSTYVLRNTSSGSATAELFLDGAGARLTIAENRALTFDILVVGLGETSGLSGSYRLQGLL